jgi:phage shock protein PspC (stress-responsive transcriptional regulator)/predicted membrane protein
MADEPRDPTGDAEPPSPPSADPIGGAAAPGEPEQPSDAPPTEPASTEVASAEAVTGADDEPAGESSEAAGSSSAAAEPPPPPTEPTPPNRRRLERSRRERMMAGVAGGIADYLDIDPVFVRVAFVLLAVLGGGAGLLLYVVAWIVMPEAREGASAPLASPSSDADGPPPSTAAPPAGGGAPLGGLVLGSLLLLAGLVWLLALVDVDVPRLDVLLAVALILTGGALLLGSLTGRHSGLIVLGVLLTLALTITSGVDADFDGGFGERTERPSTVAQLEDDYSHAFGELTLDLRGLTLPRGTTRVEASIAFGSLRVLLPSDVAVRVESDVNFGSADVLGRESSGVGADDLIQDAGYRDAERRLELQIDTTFGSAEVDR